ncbi:unnamed protein product [Closterium sp. NIES-53]
MAAIVQSMTPSLTVIVQSISPSLTTVQSVAQPCFPVDNAGKNNLRLFERRLHSCHGLAPRTTTDSTLLRTDSFPVVESTGFGCSNPAESAAVQRTLAGVSAGLLAGQAPEITPDGSGGTYMLRDATGKSRIAVFKPMDEEPLAWNCPRGMPPSLTGEGLKRGTRVGEGAFREVAAYLLDHPLREGDAEVSILGCLSSAELGIRKIGSLQQFVPAISNCEDMGPARFAASEVHKIAILDMRLANADRNGANILVKRDGADLKLIPIDHGYCLPETLEDCTFEWLYWPQAKQPLSEEVREYIAKLDVEADLSLLQANGWAVKGACARVFRAATLLLKKGSAANRTVFEIGSLMVRDDPEVPSTLEDMLARAEVKALSGAEGGDIMKCLGEIIDLYLGV